MAMDKATDERFTAYLLNAVRRALDELKYNAGDFRGMIGADGGYRAAVTLLAAKEPSDGFVRLWEAQRLDLSLEALVLNPEWSGYFSSDLLAIARKRLKDVKFELSSGASESIASEATSPSDVKLTSATLEAGKIYTRGDLRRLFDVTDATINNGVFRPKGQSSVWLFVTEKKTPDRVQYTDRLEGAQLYWQGQTSGRTDPLVVEHKQRGLELVVFYRREKYEHEGAGFRYEGVFEYVSHREGRPSSFVLQRRDAPNLSQVEADLQDRGAFSPENVVDGRQKVLGGIVLRRGQEGFRRSLLNAYARQCALSGCGLEPVLEAAHIYPYRGAETNHVTNGLLLRADLHTLFDLRLFCVNDSMEVVSKPALASKDYDWLHGSLLRLPKDPSAQPSPDALRWHRNQGD